jgi:type IV pilus assembly protein PilA
MWIALQRRGTDEGGFTLVELLVVVLIIALLAALGISSFMSQRSKAQDAEAKQVMRTASHALQVFHMDHDTYNATVAELEQIEPSLRAARNLVVNGTVNTYDIAADSASGANTYTLARHADGTVLRGCTAPGNGGCRATPDSDGQLW